MLAGQTRLRRAVGGAQLPLPLLQRLCMALEAEREVRSARQMGDEVKIASFGLSLTCTLNRSASHHEALLQVVCRQAQLLQLGADVVPAG